MPLLDTCSRQLEATRQELASAQQTLAEITDPKRTFERAAPAEAMEQRVLPAVAGALAKIPGVIHHELECRGDLCRVRVATRTREENKGAWQAFTKDASLGEIASGFASDAGEPVRDAVSGKGGFDVDYYINTRPAADAQKRIQALLDEVRRSGAMERCASQDQAQGVLEVKISVLADENRLVFAYGGPLAGTAVGDCMANVLTVAIESVRLPPGTIYGTVYATFEAPRA